ncbi:hypothetical protein DSO57_1029310 [Entomophthora muscae]|uniref:Uncharacterized protein n=1 Tax=Entomophthora muscae TaxID=34485 RepID=A0ACC2S3C5_9FUNG|nr:hypothetical protein DSO57_1029310 [Entomophthora muscae]
MSQYTELVFSAVCYLLELKNSVDPENFEELQEILSLSEWGVSSEIKSLIGDPSLIQKYEEISNIATTEASIPTTLQQIVQCVDLLDELKEALDDMDLFKEVVRALQFDNLSKTHSEVTQDLDVALASFPENQRLNVRRVFTERAVIGELSFSNFELSDAQNILRDEELYIDVLSLLYQKVTTNCSWENTLETVVSLINSRSPDSCEMFEMFLWFHHSQQTSNDPDSWYEKYCEYTFNIDSISEAPLNISEKLQNLSLNNLEGPAV